MDINKANTLIKEAWIVGVVLGGFNLFASFFGWYGSNLWNLIDVAIVFGLSFGIYKKSRTCALAMFIYLLINKIMMLSEGTLQSSGFLWAILFGYAFFQGIRGTFAYHKIIRTLKQKE